MILEPIHRLSAHLPPTPDAAPLIHDLNSAQPTPQYQPQTLHISSIYPRPSLRILILEYTTSVFNDPFDLVIHDLKSSATKYLLDPL